MFIVRLVAWLISLPLLWAGQLASLFKLPVAVPLLEAAWRIGGDGYVANAALANRRRYESTEAVLAKASDWLAQRPCPQIAAYAGLVAMTEGDLDTAQQLLARGRELGDEPRGSLDLLEACLVCKSDDKAAGDELVARWASRRDLSPAVSEFRPPIAASRCDHSPCLGGSRAASKTSLEHQERLHGGRRILGPGSATRPRSESHAGHEAN